MKDITFPVLSVQLVPTEKIQANNYNPNSVAPPEMKLLIKSIEEDGYTQPLVCYYDKQNDIYILVDGFHRYRVGKEHFKLPELPVVNINKELKERMASTIRHNRARGKHGVDGMTNIVAEMIILGWKDHQVAKELGMDLDELLRLKQNTGLAEIFKDMEFSKSWE